MQNTTVSVYDDNDAVQDYFVRPPFTNGDTLICDRINPEPGEEGNYPPMCRVVYHSLFYSSRLNPGVFQLRLDLPGGGNNILSTNNTFTGTNTFYSLKVKNASYSPTFDIDIRNGSFHLLYNDVDYLSGDQRVLRSITLIPKLTNTYDLGNSTYKWGKLFLQGAVNENSNGYGFVFPSSTSLNANSELIDSRSNQIFEGTKVTRGKLGFRYSDEAIEWRIWKASADDALTIGNYSTQTSVHTARYVFEPTRLRPETNGQQDLGSPNYYFASIYGNKLNPNSNGFGLTLPSTGSLTANSELMDSKSNQTIPGVKTFSNGLTTAKINANANGFGYVTPSNAGLTANDTLVTESKINSAFNEVTINED